MTSIAEATPAVQSVHSRMKVAAEALAALMDHDLPYVSWTIDDIHPGQLRGLIRLPETESERAVSCITAWATFLGVQVIRTVHKSAPDTAYLRATTEYRGAQVQVWVDVPNLGDADARDESKWPALVGKDVKAVMTSGEVLYGTLGSLEERRVTLLRPDGELHARPVQSSVYEIAESGTQL